jgi:hypothetical protein
VSEEASFVSLVGFFAEFNQHKWALDGKDGYPNLAYIGRLSRFLDQIRDMTSQDTKINATYASLTRFFVTLNRCKKLVDQELSAKPGLGYRYDADKLEHFLFNILPIVGARIASLRKSGETIKFWDVCGLRRNEVRTASILAWLLNPTQTHGHGAAILNALLHRLLGAHYGAFPLPTQIADSYSVVTEFYPIGDNSNRVDIVIQSAQCLIFVEVKIDAPPGEGQLNRYLAVAKGKASASGCAAYAVVYLSKVRSDLNDDHLICATWLDVASAIDDVLNSNPKNNLSTNLINQFAQYVREF